MPVSDLFLLFFLFMLVQPIIRQKMLEFSRVRQIEEIQRRRNSRVITLIHRQVSMAFFGVPLMRYIDINDSEKIIQAIRMTPDDRPIDLVIHAPGGLSLASQQIAHALSAHPGRVTVHVPHYAMSGATLIALAADEIAMDSHAMLGPVDPQVGPYPAASVLEAVTRKDANELDDMTLILADVSAKAIAQTKSAVKHLLLARMPEPEAERTAHALSTGTWTHDHPLTTEAARALGLPIVEGVDPLIYKLMQLYPQPARQRAAVEYLGQ
jgi:ClpP class serine protease